MFWNWNKKKSSEAKNNKMLDKIDKIEVRIDELLEENRILKEKVESKPKIQIQEEFDIENLQVISIERRPEESGHPCTVFSYIIDGAPGEVQESWIRNTLEEHNEFLKRFRKKLNLPVE